MPIIPADFAAILPVLVPALLVVGALAGFLAGLLGVGGGIVIVPALYWLGPHFGAADGARMHMAVGTSLATIVLTSVASARGHARHGAIDFALVRRWVAPVVIGVAAGTGIATMVGGRVLTAIFAATAFAVAINLALRPDNETAIARPPGRLVAWAGGTMIGGLSVLMGIGGGTLTVPLLSAFDYPIRRAVGTAALIGLVIAVPGTLGFIVDGIGQPGRPPFSAGYVNLVAAAGIVPATMAAVPLGVRAAHSLPPRALRRAFALFLALTAMRMGVDAWGA